MMAANKKITAIIASGPQRGAVTNHQLIVATPVNFRTNIIRKANPKIGVPNLIVTCLSVICFLDFNHCLIQV